MSLHTPDLMNALKRLRHIARHADPISCNVAAMYMCQLFPTLSWADVAAFIDGDAEFVIHPSTNELEVVREKAKVVKLAD